MTGRPQAPAPWRDLGRHLRARSVRALLGQLPSPGHPLDRWRPHHALVFGGSFDPPHLGHLLAATLGMAASGCTHLLVVPSREHPRRKQQQASFAHRLAMCRANFAPLRHVRVEDIESRLPPPNYTIEVVEALQHKFPRWRFRLLLGSDLEDSLSTWHRSRELQQLAPPVFIPRGIPAAHDPRAQDRVYVPDIASSELRHRLSAGHPGASLPIAPPVWQWIASHHLYGTAPPR